MSTSTAGLQLRKAARIILVGAPGVGKGTQSERLLKRYEQLNAISSGDLLRENVRNRTPLGIKAEDLMKRGALVPDGMILRLIRNTLLTRGWLREAGEPQQTAVYSTAAFSNTEHRQADGPMSIPTAEEMEYEHSEDPRASFILDGFPRNATQADMLDKLVPINMAIHVHTPAEIILDRICNRWIHAPSGRTYNTTFNPPKEAGFDDITGEKLTQRDDDKPEVWKDRLKQFEQSSASLLEHYDKLGILWRVEGNSSDEISPKLFSEFHQRFGA